MSPLEQLFVLKLELHRRLTTEATGIGEIAAIYTSYALQSGYEQLLACCPFTGYSQPI